MKSRIPSGISRTWVDVENDVAVSIRIKDPFDNVEIEICDRETGVCLTCGLSTGIAHDIGLELITAAERADVYREVTDPYVEEDG